MFVAAVNLPRNTGWAKKVGPQAHGHNSVKTYLIVNFFSLEDSQVNL